jgi:hypothetical protein
VLRARGPEAARQQLPAIAGGSVERRRGQNPASVAHGQATLEGQRPSSVTTRPLNINAQVDALTNSDFERFRWLSQSPLPIL